MLVGKNAVPTWMSGLVLEPTCESHIAPHIAVGNLHSARFAAIDFVHGKHAGAPPSDAMKDCSSAWVDHVDALLRKPNAITFIAEAHRSVHRLLPHQDTETEEVHCESSLFDRDTWDACCSELYPHRGRPSCNLSCCVLGAGSSASLLLPMLHEPRLNLTLPSGTMLLLEADGFLRPFDVATVLWPAGFLLAMWVADEAAAWDVTAPSCSIDDGQASGKSRVASDNGIRRPKILELGTGTGAAAIAAATRSRAASVWATDVAERSLALAAANAVLNGVRLRTHKLDWHNDDDVAGLASEHGPFDLVIGAALQFETWQETRLWSVLEALTSAGSAVALAHTLGVIDAPPTGSPFVEVTRISGLTYGLRTRWNRNESDFEIVLLRR
jgi:hypothetical protein